MNNDKNYSSVRSVFCNFLFSLRYMWKNAKLYTVLQLTGMLTEGLYPSASLLLTALLFNSLEEDRDFKTAFRILIIKAILLIVYFLWSYIFYYIVAPILNKKFHFKLQSDLLSKVHNIGLEKYDDPAFYDDYLVVMQNADSCMISSIDNIKSLFNTLFSILASAALLAYVSPLVAAAVIVSSAVSLLINTKLKKLDFQSALAFSPLNKKDQYINRVFKLSDSAKELRITEHGKTMIREYDNNVKESIKLSRVFGRRKIWLQIAEIFNSNVIYLAIISFTLYQVSVTGTVLLGGFAIVINAGWTFRNTMTQIANMISELPKQSMFISKIREFMTNKKKNKCHGLPVDSFNKIELLHVSFGYNTEKFVLNDLNLCIHRGEHIAIVGSNGAGKSTLIKLLLGLYKPSKGTVLYNGVDVSLLDTDAYRKKFGIVFQDYRIFAASVAENVWADSFSEKYKKNVEDALKLADFEDKLTALENGVSTQLTREFDDNGVCLSGGEEQKIAIARAIAKSSDIIIMDEPSSALDPIAEQKLTSNIREYGKEKTVIYISHRLSTTKNVDHIYVLDGSNIIESGSHEELMRINGKYARMFNVQAEKYKCRKS